jgi:D-tyrosyl-tRNA(Tyr) deacylase
MMVLPVAPIAPNHTRYRSPRAIFTKMLMRHSGNIVFKISMVKYSVVCNHLNYLTVSVSQFTLLASTKKGSKPDFHGAMSGPEARGLYERFVRRVQEEYKADKVKDGVFQAMMEVALVNDGPVSVPCNFSSLY